MGSFHQRANKIHGIASRENLLFAGNSFIAHTRIRFTLASFTSQQNARDDGQLFSGLVLKAFKMAMLSAAALLDELMGVDRDRAPDEKKTALHWSDPQVVKIRR